jgi:hypothetical protein
MLWGIRVGVMNKSIGYERHWAHARCEWLAIRLGSERAQSFVG